MKKRIKITTKLLKEDDTEKRLRQKISKEQLEAALSDAPVEKGMLQKLKNYFLDKLFPSPAQPEKSLDSTEKMPMDSDDDGVPGGGRFSAIPGPSVSPEQQPEMEKVVGGIDNLKRSLKQVQQAQAKDRDAKAAKRFGKDPDYFDKPDDPDYLEQFRNLQEIARRHFKKRD
jgi:hypothetical protein